MNNNNTNPKPMSSGDSRMKRNIQRNRERKKKSSRSRNSSQHKSQNIQRSEAPVSMGFKSEFMAPQMSVKGQNTIVKHREYITDVTSSVQYQIGQAFAMNPGIAVSFPWLSQVAQRFEKYRFRFLRYTFETLSPTTSVGMIMLVPDFDAEDPPPLTKTTALSYKSSVRTQLWERIALDVKREDLSALPQYYVRAGPMTGVDIKTYDVGNLFVCSSGAASAVPCGELWVEYEVELLAPTIQQFETLYTPSGMVLLNAYFTSTSNNQLFGNPATAIIKNNNIPAFLSSDGTTLNFTGYFKGIVMFFIDAYTASSPVNPITIVNPSGTIVALDDVVYNNTLYQAKGSFFLTTDNGGSFMFTNILLGGDLVNPDYTKVYLMPYSN